MTVAISPAATAPGSALGLRVVRAPRSEPPTDDERTLDDQDAPPMSALLLPLDLTGPQLAQSRRYAETQVVDAGTTGATAGAAKRSGQLSGPTTGPTPGPTAGSTAGRTPGRASGRTGGRTTNNGSAGPVAGGSHGVSPTALGPASGASKDNSDGASKENSGGTGGSWSSAGSQDSVALPVMATVDLTAAEPPDIEPSPARLATRRFLASCVEVIGGFRPLAQLRPLCFPERFAEIAARLSAHPATGPGWRSRGLAHLASRGSLGGRGALAPPLAGRGGPAPLGGRGALAPPRGGRANQTGPGDRVLVRRVQICEAVDGVAEIAVVLGRRDRIWAMAIRMERRRGRWLCTHLEVL